MSHLSCDDVHELLSAALDGELDPAEAVRLDEHLAACAACAVHRERLAEVRDVFRSLTPAAPPRDLASSVMDRIRAGEAGEPGQRGAAPASELLPAASRRRWRWTSRVAAALLLVGAGAGVLWHGRASDAVVPAEPPTRIASPALQDLGLDAGCEGGNCLQLRPCDSPAECGGGPPCSDPGECGGTFR